MLKRGLAVVSLSFLVACGGGGGGSPTAPSNPAPAPTPIPEGRIVLGDMVATYTPTGQACGDFEMHLPYTIQSGPIRLRAYDWRIYEAGGSLETRVSGNWTAEGAPEFEPQAREFSWGPRFVCLWNRGGTVDFKQRYTTHSGATHDLHVVGTIQYR